MSNQSFRKGDLVRFRFGRRFVQGQIKEDRGPIGIKGRHLYSVAFCLESHFSSVVELPAEDLIPVEEPTSIE